MATATDVFATFNAKGIREDLEGVIYNISPYETPGQANFGSVKVKERFHEWQVDTLRAASTSNARIEGSDATVVARVATTRMGNRTQILDDVVAVTGTIEAVDRAGRKGEMAYHLTKTGRELRRDFEKIIFNNQASVIGTSGVAPKLGGLPSWLTTNDSRDTDGVQGGYSTSTNLTVAATDSTGSGRTFTETLLKAVQQLCVVSGAEPSILMLGPYNKGQFSNATNFPGIATLRSNIAQNNKGSMATVIGAADVYLGDFGTLQVIVNIFQRERDAWLLDPEYIKVGTLRPLDSWELAKTGDHERRQVLMEKTLVVTNEAAHGVVADLKTS